MALFPPLSLYLKKWLFPTFKKSKLLILTWSLVTMYMCWNPQISLHWQYSLSIGIQDNDLWCHSAVVFTQKDVIPHWREIRRDGLKISEWWTWHYDLQKSHPDLFSDIHYCLGGKNPHTKCTILKRGKCITKNREDVILHNFFVSINMHI